uniref:F-box domain-containing protein n=2 Tax=Oryza TaxID=4527 RepID=A0A0E0NVM9_ORYRU
MVMFRKMPDLPTMDDDDDKMGTHAQVQQLPDELLLEILLRLPPRAIARCLAVCSAWSSAVSAAAFRRAHADRPAAVCKATATAIDCCDRDAVVLDAFLGRWHRGNVHTTPRSPRGLVFPAAMAPEPDTPWVLDTLVVGSWDGVLCVERGAPLLRGSRWDAGVHHWPKSGRFREYVLWNPLAMTRATVSPPPGRGAVIGGYAHPATMRFHLLHAAGEAARRPGSLGLFVPTVFRVQRVGDGAWREVPLPLLEQQDDHAHAQLQMHGARSVALHGNLHWLVQRGGSAGPGRLQVLVFEPARERFRLMEAPPRRHGEEDDLARSRIVVLSNGKLCAVAVRPATSTMEMWVLDSSSSDAPRRWRLDAYSLRRRKWTRVCAARPRSGSVGVALLPHRESVADDQPSFGEASRLLDHTIDIDVDDQYLSMNPITLFCY